MGYKTTATNKPHVSSEPTLHIPVKHFASDCAMGHSYPEFCCFTSGLDPFPSDEPLGVQWTNYFIHIFDAATLIMA